MSLMLKSKGEIIALGDMLQSITMLQFNGAAIKEVARDFTCNYMRAIEIIDDNTFIGAEDNENIFFVRREIAAAGKEDGDTGRLEGCAEYHLGELVNTFCRGSLSNKPLEHREVSNEINHAIALDDTPKVDSSESSDHKSFDQFPGFSGQSILFGTVSGSIGTILTLDKATYRFFACLQKCILLVSPNIGGLSHSDWRNFVNERRFGIPSMCNVIDGDVIEQFLFLSQSEMNKIVVMLNDELSILVQGDANEEKDFSIFTLDAVRNKIEDISRCH
jgi:DNA damage-binding protein 1